MYSLDVSPGEDFESAKQTVGTRIRKRREKLKLSQEALAEMARVDRKHMSRIESGKVEAGFWTLNRIAIALQTTTAAFVRGLKWDPETDKYGHPKKDSD
jgi:transcriptional regulator with XRE-family HTH domain